MTDYGSNFPKTIMDFLIIGNNPIRNPDNNYIRSLIFYKFI